jgi:thymidylate synthase (FAD)
MRINIEEANAMLDKKISVLDHGWVVPVDYMGGDQRIVDAARVSIAGDKVKATASNENLIRYLLRHKHTTPFEKVRFEFAAKMPMFVARQWVRHRMSSINEMSARYGQLPKEFYLPEITRMQVQSTDNKQGSGETMGYAEATVASNVMKVIHDQSYKSYEILLEEYGLAREVARGVLPVNIYTQWYWTIDLWNLMHFLNLRLHSHAQYEIRVYAEAMETFVRAVCPLAMEAFDDYIRYSETFSNAEMAVLLDMIHRKAVDEYSDELLLENLGTKRELKEFKQKIGI